jgi:hypothetical protein
MAIPSELVTHYSSKALQTRLAALGFVGAVLGADVVWDDRRIPSDTLGIGLLLVVGSLAELNRRYTYSYLCACLASARSESHTQMWRDFTKMNEAPWSSKALEKWKYNAEKKKGEIKRKEEDEMKHLRRFWLGVKTFAHVVGRVASRFLLSWATYLPGVAAGLYLAWSNFYQQELSLNRIVKLSAATSISVVLLAWWFAQSLIVYNPECLLEE